MRNHFAQDILIAITWQDVHAIRVGKTILTKQTKGSGQSWIW